MAGFCNSMPALWTPKFAKCEANSPKASRHYREYSRFPETDHGDRVRSVLVDRCGSPICRRLHDLVIKSGISDRAMRMDAPAILSEGSLICTPNTYVW